MDVEINKVEKLKPYIIGLAGGSASGKTSVSYALFESIEKFVGKSQCSLITLDSYYKNPSYNNKYLQ